MSSCVFSLSPAEEYSIQSGFIYVHNLIPTQIHSDTESGPASVHVYANDQQYTRYNVVHPVQPKGDRVHTSRSSGHSQLNSLPQLFCSEKFNRTSNVCRNISCNKLKSLNWIFILRSPPPCLCICPQRIHMEMSSCLWTPEHRIYWRSRDFSEPTKGAPLLLAKQRGWTSSSSQTKSQEYYNPQDRQTDTPLTAVLNAYDLFRYLCMSLDQFQPLFWWSHMVVSNSIISGSPWNWQF